MSPQLKKDLKAATDGLLYPSDTDAEFELVELSPPFPWQADTTPSVAVPLRQFFAELLNGPDGAAFHLLRQVLELRLTDVAVHRVGQVALNIYVTGVERDGEKENRVGVKTHAVET